MPNAILNVGQTGGQVNISTAAAPATPAVGVVTLYAGTDKALHALNSDGTDITIAAGMTGPTGPQGQTGATGPAGSNATSPITIEQTSSLVSTAIGATAGAGANCAVVIGTNATAPGASLGGIAIGNAAAVSCGFSPACGQIAIGDAARTNRVDGIAIGRTACGAEGGIAIGAVACAQLNSVSIGKSTVTGFAAQIAIGSSAQSAGQRTIAMGENSCALGDSSIAHGRCTFTCSAESIAIGCSTVSLPACSIAIGSTSKTFPGATGTIVLGNSSNGGTGACNSVVIGNSACATGINSVVMGQAACSTECCNIAIGVGAKASVGNAVAIGTCATSRDAGVAIGVFSCLSAGPYGFGGVAIGFCARAQDFRGTAIGGLARTTNGVAIGNNANACGDQATVAIAYGSLACGDSISIGELSCATTACGLAISRQARSTSACAISIGTDSLSCHSAAVVLGPNLTSVRADTTHVNSLVAFGQAASITNAVGSTGGSVTLNWNNSNIQTLTLTSNITTLTKSNPIDGAVYTLFLTQGASGGYTVAWGADVEWAGGTGPTLSTAAGAVDAVSLVYIAGVTGYYGNANLNFS